MFCLPSALHVLAVNGRFELLRRCMHLVHEKFSEADRHELLTIMCEGAFFKEEPQRDYGGHIMSYIACFGHLELVRECVEELGFRDWSTWECKVTGYLAVHAAVQDHNLLAAAPLPLPLPRGAAR